MLYEGFVLRPTVRLSINSRTDTGLDITCEQPLDQPPHNYRCITSDDGGRSFVPVIDGCFERVFSLVLRLEPSYVPLQNILASQSHRQRIYLLPPAKRRLLRDSIKLEYYHTERVLTQARRDTATLRTEYEFAVALAHLVAPIHRLPVELLMLILTFILDEQNMDNIDTLMRTCHKWQDIVSSMLAPLKLATWTSIDKVKNILEGGNRPLLVTIHPSRDAMDHQIGSEPYAALTLATSTSTSRWRTLDIPSLPDPQQISDLFAERRTTNPVPMNHLRSLSIPIRHDSSPFLSFLLPSIGAMTSVHLTDMYLCSVQATLYLAQPHCAQVFNHLTSFRCFLPRMGGVIDILPRFWQLEIMDVSCLCFPAYHSDIELPLTKTLRQMSLRAVPIGWMNHREFLRLESCSIFSPPLPVTTPITSLPLCTKLQFEGPHFDVFKKFHIPTARTLVLRSPQWSKSRGNNQLSHFWRVVPSTGGLRPTSLYLSITCSSELLLRALCFMPELKELTLELGRPTALGSCFFIGLLPLSLRTTQSHKSAEEGAESLQACPVLEVLRLKYRRWFRPGESNELPALVAMAHFDKREPKLKIWVDKAEESVSVDCTELSGSILCSLGLLKPSDAGQPQSEVVKEAIEASFAILNPLGTRIHHPKTMVQISPSIYSCLFQQLREFKLYVDIDQSVLFKALTYFEHLEVVHVRRIGPSSSKPHLPLFRTLKRLELGTTFLSWMDECTFTKLEFFEISGIDGVQPACVQMPICQSASFPHGVSPYSLSAFKLPRLCDLVLSGHSAGLPSGCEYPSLQQFRLHTASFHFVSSTALKEILALQPELETLEIRDLDFRSQPGKGLPDLLDMLMEPHKLNGFGGHDHSGCATISPRQQLLLCPKLKELKLKLRLGQEWKWELVCKEEQRQELERQQQLAGRLEQVLTQVQEVEYLVEVERVRARARERVRVMELELEDVGGENQRISQVQQCQKFIERRTEKGCALQRCQLVWVLGESEIANKSVELPCLDIPDPGSPGLGDIFASWESHDP